MMKGVQGREKMRGLLSRRGVTTAATETITGSTSGGIRKQCRNGRAGHQPQWLLSTVPLLALADACALENKARGISDTQKRTGPPPRLLKDSDQGFLCTARSLQSTSSRTPPSIRGVRTTYAHLAGRDLRYRPRGQSSPLQLADAQNTRCHPVRPIAIPSEEYCAKGRRSAERQTCRQLRHEAAG